MLSQGCVGRRQRASATPQSRPVPSEEGHRLNSRRRPQVRLLVLAGLSLAALLHCAPASARDEELQRRVEDLLSRMTLEEKVGQLNLVSNGPLYRPDELPQGRVGAAINFNNSQDIAAAQAATRRSRLRIPVLFGLDILHGFRTMFPVPLAETATFDPALARLSATVAAREAAHIGVRWTYAPMADLSRDPRWGRMVEGSGEDPYLAQMFTAARVQGFHDGGLATAVKHFAGYAAGLGGRDYDATEIPPATLRDLYLPPFKAAVEAGTETVMSAFNALNGVPSTANPALLDGILRGEWGFSGFVVSDWAAIAELVAHGIASDGAEAARKAILAGVDMDLMGGLYDAHLADEVRAGRVPEAVVDRAVRRVLATKARLGLFERPDADPTRNDAGFPTPESRRAARAVAEESMVLLRNQDGVLPIAAGRAIAVVGPFAGDRREMLGPHGARGHAEDAVSILDAMRERAAGAGSRITYAQACDADCLNETGFAEAEAAARGADVVVAVLGEKIDLSGEAASRAYLTLPGRQDELLRRLVGTGKPVVLVLVSGRPNELGPVVDRLAGLMLAWYPGTEGGPALAALLFGDANPSGKLPITWPRTVGQVPLVYNRLPTGRPTLADNRFTVRYADESVEPLYPFGYGLGYSRFTFSDLHLADDRLQPGDTLDIRVRVANAGPRAGKVAVQAYLRDLVASRSRPLRELKAFSKIALEPGESRDVALAIPVAELGFHREDASYVVEPGQFQLWVGEDSRAELTIRFEVLGP
jgi:beta-glucosidase